MHVWLIQIGEELPLSASVRKMRTGLLATELARRGHEVVWWASAFDHFTKSWHGVTSPHQIGENLSIVLLRGIGYRKNFSVRRFIDHRLLAWQFERLASRGSLPDIIVAATPTYDLALAAARFAQRRDIPLIVDVRDKWPIWFLEFCPRWIRPILRLALYPEVRQLRRCLSAATALTSNLESLLSWALGESGRSRTPNDRVFYLGSEPLRQDPITSERSHRLVRQCASRLPVAYVGSFGDHNHPGLLLSAAKQFDDDEMYFLLIGDGVYRERLERNAKSQRNVTFTGWLNFDELSHLLPHCKIGVHLLAVPEATFPNKVFLYFAAGLPLVSGASGDLSDLLKSEEIGLTYIPGSCESLAQALRDLAAQVRIHDFRPRVRSIFEHTFHAATIYGCFSDYIEQMVATGVRTSRTVTT